MLRDYGQLLWRSRASVGEFKDTICAVLESRRDWRSHMTEAWDLYTEWGNLEPTEHTSPLPLPAIRAAVCVALLLKDFEFVAVVLCAFGGGTRIGEAYRLRRCDVLLPIDTLWDASSGRRPVVFLVLRDTKTSTHGGATTQHALIDDPAIVAFLVWWCTPMDRDQLLFPPRDNYAWCERWAAILRKHLDIPTTGPTGFTPNCLRASHSTESYLLYGSLERIRWQLRHRAQRVTTLEHYIQELPSALARAQWSAKARAMVAAYSARADAVLAAAVLGRLGSMPIPARVFRPRRRRQRAQSTPATTRPRNTLARELAALQTSHLWYKAGGSWEKKVAA